MAASDSPLATRLVRSAADGETVTRRWDDGPLDAHYEREREDDIEHPTWPEVFAYDGLLRDREQYYRRRGWWERMWDQTVLLESLRTKMHRAFHRRRSD